MAHARRGLASLASALALSSACSAQPKGALMLAISTDMQTPKDIDVVSVFVATGGVPKLDYVGRVLPDGTVSLPSTLALVQPDDPSAQVRIRVVGFQTQGQEENARVLRDVVTTVPSQVTALLRLPLDFIDDGSGQGTLPAQYVPEGVDDAPDGLTQFDPTTIASSCDPMKLCETQGAGCRTMIDGACASAAVDSSTLPAYSQVAVFGAGGVAANGAPASCFDVASCFAGATPVTGVDPQACAFPLPQGASAATLNVALATQGTGACVPSGQCYVPLPDDPDEGWTAQGGAVTLAPGVCGKLGSGVTVAVSPGACPAETLSDPVCEPTGLGAGEPEAGAGAPDATASTSSDAGAASDAAAPLNPRGTVVVPDGARGVAVVHVEDATGALLATPVVSEIPANGDVVLVAEPPDMSQGVVATTTALQTLNGATTSPTIVDDVVTATIDDGGPAGPPVSVAVFADSTFSSVQMQNVYDPFVVCFTGGLHLAQDQIYTYTSASQGGGQCSSPDGTVLASTNAGSGTVLLQNVMATLSPHEISYTSDSFAATAAPAVVTGRGAMGFDPTTSDTLLYAAADGTLYAFSAVKTDVATGSIALPGAPAGASVAYAPSGKYAIVATSAGLFTVSVGAGADGGAAAPSVVSGPANPSYTGSDGNTYALSGAQSIAITSDGSYLVALTDEPSPDDGTLLAMPLDASGDVGAVGMARGGFTAAARADVLSAY